MAVERGEDGTLLFSLSFGTGEQGGIDKRETETERADRELTLNN